MNNQLSDYSVSFNNNELQIVSGQTQKIVTLPSAIDEVEKFDHIIIVSINPKASSFLNENLYGISYDGKILWQIEKIDHVSKQSPYTGMSKEGDLLIAYNWDGFEYYIVPLTGKIIKKVYVK